MSEDIPICVECRKEIKLFQKYVGHKDGTILCLPCYDKLIKEGKIK